MMKWGLPAISCCMGLKRPRTPGMTKYACWSFLAIFWNLMSEIFSCFRMDLIVLKFPFDSFGDSCMIYFVPFVIHPKISFMGSHLTSPWDNFFLDNFFLEIGYSQGWCVNSGGRNMEWIPWTRQRDTWVRWSLLWVFVAPIKSSANTSMRLTYGLDDYGWSDCWCIVFIIIFSNWWEGRGSPIFISFLMTSWAVSVLELNRRGLPQKPIYMLLGTTILM